MSRTTGPVTTGHRIARFTGRRHAVLDSLVDYDTEHLPTDNSASTGGTDGATRD